MMAEDGRALVWFRRDLRDFDHAALSAALHSAPAVYCLFVFDRDILEALPTQAGARAAFIHESLRELDRALQSRGGGLIVRAGRATEEVPRVAREVGASQVFANRDYEPLAIARDAAVARSLEATGITWHSCKDQVIFESGEIVTAGGRPYAVYTPYRNAWLKKLGPADIAEHSCTDPLRKLRAPPRGLAGAGMPSLAALGVTPVDLAARGVVPGMDGGQAVLARFSRQIDSYAQTRDFPAQGGTSRLSVHLRFGTVSVRHLVAMAQAKAAASPAGGAAKWRDELIWREFYSQLLANHPHVVDQPFRPAWRNLAFRNDPADFAAWAEGRTGYPLVDAAMRELEATGWMHNRLRMVVASFLVKDLLVDWRWGERHFASRLVDYELASNNGGWQWSASTGCDAQPWFRIFNPVAQSERFDPDGTFIRRWVPELATLAAPDIHAPWRTGSLGLAARGIVLGRDYPMPIVDHTEARARTLAAFRAVADATVAN